MEIEIVDPVREELLTPYSHINFGVPFYFKDIDDEMFIKIDDTVKNVLSLKDYKLWTLSNLGIENVSRLCVMYKSKLTATKIYK